MSPEYQPIIAVNRSALFFQPSFYQNQLTFKIDCKSLSFLLEKKSLLYYTSYNLCKHISSGPSHLPFKLFFYYEFPCTSLPQVFHFLLKSMAMLESKVHSFPQPAIFFPYFSSELYTSLITC